MHVVFSYIMCLQAAMHGVRLHGFMYGVYFCAVL